MYLIDTNIFLEVIRDQENSEQCQKLLERISEGKIKAAVSKFTVHAVERHSTKYTEVVNNFLENIEKSFGLEIVDTSIAEEKEASKLSSQSGLDFDDSLQYYVALKEDIEAIVSFDTDFDDVEIDRKEPSDLI